MASFMEIQKELENIECDFNKLVERVSKSVNKENSSSDKAGPKYNNVTMKWELPEEDEIDLDWGDITETKEELKIDFDAFIVPVLDYRKIELS